MSEYDTELRCIARDGPRATVRRLVQAGVPREEAVEIYYRWRRQRHKNAHRRTLEQKQRPHLAMRPL